MEFKLNLQERIIFLSLLPSENNFTTLRIIRKVVSDLGISDEEYKYYKVKPIEGGRVSFDPVKAQEEKDFEISEVAMHLVKTELEKLDKENKLTQEHLPLYEKLIENSKETKA